MYKKDELSFLKGRIKECKKEEIDSILSSVMRLLKNSSDRKEWILLYRMLAILHRKKMDFHPAIHSLQKSIQYAKETEKIETYYELQIDLGVYHYYARDYHAAIEIYLSILPFFEKGNNEKRVAQLNNNLGVVYYDLHQLDKALTYYQKCQKYREKIDDIKGLMSIYNNIGNIYFDKKLYSKALLYHQKSYKLAKEEANEIGIARSLNNIGLILKKENRFQEALNYLKKAIKINQKKDQIWSIANTIINIGDCYLGLQDWKQAEINLEEGRKLANELQDKKLKKDCFAGLYELAFQKKHYEEALKWYQEMIRMEQLLIDERVSEQITKLEKKYQFNKRIQEAEIYRLKNVELAKANLELEKSQQKYKQLNRNLEQRVQTEIAKRHAQQEKVFQQARLASLGELASGIAHEINQPLQSLSFTIENIRLAMAEKRADIDYFEKKFSFLFQDIDRMQKIINHIRIFSRNESDAPYGAIQLNESIQNAVSMVQEQYANKGIVIQLKTVSNLPHVLGNIYKFEQVVLNLLSNSRDALLKKEEKMERYFEKIISIETNLIADDVIMTFADNGIGISKEYQNKIFNPFFTTKDPGKGTGLGLSISYNIVRSMNGKMEIDPAKATGFKINLIFPAKKGER